MLPIAEINPRAYPPGIYRERLATYLIERKTNEVLQVLRDLCYSQKHYSLYVSSCDMIDFDPELAFLLFKHSKLLLPLFDDAAVLAQQLLSQNLTNETNIKRNVHIRIYSLPAVGSFEKNRLNRVLAADCDRLIQVTGTIIRTRPVRLLELSKQFECCNPKCRYRFTVYADRDQNNVIPHPKFCPAGSLAKKRSRHDGQGRNVESSEEESRVNCSSNQLREVPGSKVCVDFQELVIQDVSRRVHANHEGGRGFPDVKSGDKDTISEDQFDQNENTTSVLPSTLTCCLTADLADLRDVCVAGNEVVVVGVPTRTLHNLIPNCRPAIGVSLQVNSILSRCSISGSRLSVSSVHRFDPVNPESSKASYASEDELFNSMKFQSYWSHFRTRNRLLEGRDHIVAAVCPQLSGLYLAKLALLLTIIGGNSEESVTYSLQQPNAQAASSTTGPSVRSQCHLLLVGDPGCGKSQLLKFAVKLTPRGVLTTGLNSTTAGLTGTILSGGDTGPGPSGYSVEVGALVLANNGVCCIDEFASMRNADRVAIHEAMEQCTVSINKANIHVVLPANTSIVASCNSKNGKFDSSIGICNNIAIGPALLSRFDIILILVDTPSKDWDREVSTFLLKAAMKCAENSISKPRISSAITNDSELLQLWHVGLLREYVQHIKTSKRPVLSSAAQALLTRYYHIQRQRQESGQYFVPKNGSSTIPNSSVTTVRLLESLVRISEAHAKLMYRDTVEWEDAVVAAYLVHCRFLDQESLSDISRTLQTTFPEDATSFFGMMEKKICEVIGSTKVMLLEFLQNESSTAEQGMAHSNGRIERNSPKAKPMDSNCLETDNKIRKPSDRIREEVVSVSLSRGQYLHQQSSPISPVLDEPLLWGDSSAPKNEVTSSESENSKSNNQTNLENSTSDGSDWLQHEDFNVSW